MLKETAYCEKEGDACKRDETLFLWKDSFSRGGVKKFPKNREGPRFGCMATTDVINSSAEDSLLSGSDKDFIIPNLFLCWQRAKDCVSEWLPQDLWVSYIPPHTAHRTAQHAHNNKQQHDAAIIFSPVAADSNLLLRSAGINNSSMNHGEIRP